MKELCDGRWQDVAGHSCRLPARHDGQCICPCGARGHEFCAGEDDATCSGRRQGARCGLLIYDPVHVVRNAETP